MLLLPSVLAIGIASMDLPALAYDMGMRRAWTLPLKTEMTRADGDRQ